jgi:hypothetical protein
LDSLLRSIGSSLSVDAGASPIWPSPCGLRPDDLTGLRPPLALDIADDQLIVRAADDALGRFRALRTDDLENWARDHPQWVNRI